MEISNDLWYDSRFIIYIFNGKTTYCRWTENLYIWLLNLWAMGFKKLLFHVLIKISIYFFRRSNKKQIHACQVKEVRQFFLAWTGFLQMCAAVLPTIHMTLKNICLIPPAALAFCIDPPLHANGCTYLKVRCHSKIFCAIWTWNHNST